MCSRKEFFPVTWTLSKRNLTQNLTNMIAMCLPLSGQELFVNYTSAVTMEWTEFSTFMVYGQIGKKTTLRIAKKFSFRNITIILLLKKISIIFGTLITILIGDSFNMNLRSTEVVGTWIMERNLKWMPR